MVRVLIIDDSAVVRKVLSHELALDPEIEVVGTAPDAFAAAEMIKSCRPDVLSLDIEMPGMDGLTFLRRLMKARPMPVVILSSIAVEGSTTAVEALSLGALYVVAKPHGPTLAAQAARELAGRLKAAAGVSVGHQAASRTGTTAIAPASRTELRGALARRLLAIGASTGGTRAIESLLRQLPVHHPATVITQHMPGEFTKSFAARLARETHLNVEEAEDGDALTAGRVLIAPGSCHLLVRKKGSELFVAVRSGPLVSGHRPSVNVMFRSVARNVGASALGVILTGMGKDGAKGMLEMKRAGAWTIAQNEASCVVFGMPKVAIELGGVCETRALEDIPGAIVRKLSRAKVEHSGGESAMKSRNEI